MPETSRDVVVVLLDETTFAVPVKPTLLATELLDMAASHCKMKEKEYFGLMTDGEGYKNWLELDKPVLDPSQDLPKGTGQVKIHFTFKYFVDELRYLQDFMTVELLYHFSRQAIMKGDVVTDDDTVFELAACAMQAQYGEFKGDKEALQQLKQLKVIPASVFSESSVQHCEHSVLHYYRMMVSLSRGDAIFKYLEIIQTLPMYSMHYFDVKDKKEALQWLGVGPDGIMVSSSSNRNDPDPSVTQRFQWLQLQNIYYRDKKFSMEVYQSTKANKKGSFGPVSIQAWYGSNSKVVMAIWKMARDQHMFYRSKRASRSPHVPGMNQTDILRQLNKLHASNISPSSSQSSLSVESARSNQMQASAEAVAAAKAAQNEMYQALLSRRQTQLADFEKKAARYKDLLVKEMQITGIPPEGLTPEEIERMRKKFGVSFKFSKFVLDDSTAGDTEVEELEKQLEIQSSIIEASKTLLTQANTRRLKKDRKKEIKDALGRYQVLEDRLQEVKRSKRGSSGLGSSSRFHVDSPTNSTVALPTSILGGARTGPSGSVDDTYIANIIWDSPSHPDGGLAGSNLQKSPLHKSTSALSEMKEGGASTPPQPPVSSAQSLNYQGHSHLATPSPRPYNSDRYNASPTAPYHSHHHHHDDLDLSPPSSMVSVNHSGLRNHSGLHDFNHSGLRNQSGLPDFNLTEEIFQHFSARDSKQVTPPPSALPDYMSPRQPGSEQHPHYPVPHTSSPIKRESSPDLGIAMQVRGDQRARSNSPDLFLPTPEHYRQQPVSHSYSSSHQASAPGRNAFSNPPSRSNSKPNFRPGTTGANPQPAPNPHWYDGMGTGYQQQPMPVHRQQHSDMGLLREEGGAYRQGQQPQRSAAMQSPRRQNDDTLDMQEFLQTLAESKTNPFGEGTLV